MRGWRNIYHANGCQKKAGVAIITLVKLDFKTKTVTDEEGHYIIIKGTIQQRDLTIVNIYVPDLEAMKKIKQLIRNIKKLIDNNTTIVGYFNTPLISIDHLKRKSKSKR